MAANDSRTRRTRVAPNHRPSSSMAAGTRPSHFFKIILPSTIHDNKLMIPVKFVMEFGDELSNVATLTVPNGHFWQVGLEKANREIWFDDGWQDFMEHHSIHYGYFLVFRYEGNSKFHVLVLDNTATEIQYPLSKDSELEDAVDIIDLDDATKSRHDKLNENEMSHSDELSAEHEENREKLVGKSFFGESSAEGRERAIEAAKMLKPTNPSFMTFVRPYHIRGRAQHPLYVPSGFAKKYLIGHASVKLQTCDGKQWHAPCSHNTLSCSRSSRNIGRWAGFCRDNHLEVGDVCVFELIKTNPVLLNVSIFHVADYILTKQ